MDLFHYSKLGQVGQGDASGICYYTGVAGVALGAPTMGWIGEAVGIESGLALSSGAMVLALATVLGARKRI